MALEFTTEYQDVQTAACVGLFSTIVQSAVQHAFHMEIVQHIEICCESFEKVRFHLECKSVYPRSHRYSKRGNHGVEVLREKCNPCPEGDMKSKAL